MQHGQCWHIRSYYYFEVATLADPWTWIKVPMKTYLRSWIINPALHSSPATHNIQSINTLLLVRNSHTQLHSNVSQKLTHSYPWSIHRSIILSWINFCLNLFINQSTLFCQPATLIVTAIHDQFINQPTLLSARNSHTYSWSIHQSTNPLLSARNSHAYSWSIRQPFKVFLFSMQCDLTVTSSPPPKKNSHSETLTLVLDPFKQAY